MIEKFKPFWVMDNPINYNFKKVAIFGLAKSGTTGLFYSIKQALGVKDDECIFEPTIRKAAAHALSHSGNTLSKILIGRAANKSIIDILRDSFTHIVVIQRNPLDRLISLLHWRHAHIFGDIAAQMYVSSIDSLSSNTSSLSRVYDCCSQLSIVSGFDLIKDFIDRERSFSNFSDSLKQSLGASVIQVAYDDFADDEMEKLSTFLGVQVVNERSLSRHQHVRRTAESSRWQGYYGQQDISIFDSLLKHNLIYIDLDQFVVNPCNAPLNSGTEYIVNLINKNRSRLFLPQFSAERHPGDVEFVPSEYEKYVKDSFSYTHKKDVSSAIQSLLSAIPYNPSLQSSWKLLHHKLIHKRLNISPVDIEKIRIVAGNYSKADILDLLDK